MAEKKRLYEDFEEYEVTEERHPTKAGIVIRYIFYFVILLINVAIIFRVCMAENPGSIDKPTINDTLRDAYAGSEDITVLTQTVYDMFTSDGCFYATGMFYFPDAEQLQVSIRYNVRTISQMIDSPSLYREPLGRFPVRDIGTYSSLTDIHEPVTVDEIKAGEFFAFRLSDNNGTYYAPSDISNVSRSLYQYRKLTFDGVTVDNDSLYVFIYPLSDDGTPDYTRTLGKMKIYSVDRETYEYKLSGSEKSKLGK